MGDLGIIHALSRYFLKKKESGAVTITKVERGFTLIELITVIAIVGVLFTVLIPNLVRAHERALYASAVSTLHNLGTHISSCASDYNFESFPTDIGAGARPTECLNFTWPTGSDVPFNSTFDYENWDLGSGDRWIGITFYGKNNSRASIPFNTDLGPGLQEHGSGDDKAYSFAL